MMNKNEKLLQALSEFLNLPVCPITTNQIKKITACHVDEETAYRLLLSYYLDLKDFESYEFQKMIHLQKKEQYQQDAYYQSIKLPHKKSGKWEIKTAMYAPYECFVMDDFLVNEQGQLLPQLGFFATPFYYPAVFEQNRLWMSVTPNEINTMKEDIDLAHGKVVTLGLGLGYFAFHCARKETITSVTIVEKDADVIELFKKHILPQFPNPEKIRIIHEDAFSFLNHAMQGEIYDFLFADIWHDVGDGLPLYLQLKKYEEKFPHTFFRYWIEKSIRVYLR